MRWLAIETTLIFETSLTVAVVLTLAVLASTARTTAVLALPVFFYALLNLPSGADVRTPD
jgi:hypothetical protein